MQKTTTTLFRQSVWLEESTGQVLDISEEAACKEKASQDFIFVDVRMSEDRVDLSRKEPRYGLVDRFGIFGESFGKSLLLTIQKSNAFFCQVASLDSSLASASCQLWKCCIGFSFLSLVSLNLGIIDLTMCNLNQMHTPARGEGRNPPTGATKNPLLAAGKRE